MMNVLLSAIGLVLFAVTVWLALSAIGGLLAFLVTLLLAACVGAEVWKLYKAGFYDQNSRWAHLHPTH